MGSPGPGNSAGKADYPTKAVNIVVPFPPGQSPDLIARALSEGAKGAFPQPFVVVNRPGGAGTIGIAEVVMARADGYTVGLSPIAPLIVQPQITSDLPYKRPDDYRPVMKIGSVPMVFSVLADSPWKSIKDVIDYAKANPGKMRVGSSGLGSIPHMDLELFKEKAGVDLTHVPVPGVGRLHPRAAGRAHRGDLGFAAAGARPGARGQDPGARHLRGETQPHPAGRAAPSRSSGSTSRSGSTTRYSCPKGTPDAVVKALGDALKKSMDTEPFRKFVESSNYVVDYQDGAVLKKQLDADYDRMGPIITKLGLKK